MNDWDKDNLNFIMTASKAELDEFYEQCDPSDLKYISKLINSELAKLNLALAEYFDEIDSVDQANAVLSKFKLK